MEFVKQTSPYIRKESASTKRMMIDVLIALLPVVVFAIYRFGTDAIIRIVVSLIIMIGLEAVAFAMMQRAKGNNFKERIKSRFQKYTINNVTAPAVSAIIYAMIVPSQLPLYAVIVGAIFAIVVVKMMFGGLGSNIFNVAAAGRIFISIALTGMFVGTYVGVDAVAGATALTASGSMGFPNVLYSYPLKDLLFGLVPGTMGEVNAIAILIGLVYLLIRKSADFRIVLSTGLTFVVLMAIVGLIRYEDDWFIFVLYQLLSGGLLFGLTFMVTDPVTAPVTGPGRLIYGLIIGSVIVFIRIFGSYAEGVAFALLFANVFAPLIDYPSWSSNKYSKKFIIGFSIASLLIIGTVVTALLVGGAA